MAKIWKVEGTAQRGAPAAVLPWLKCKELLALDDYTGTEERPKFGDRDTFPIPTNIVASLEPDEAREHGIAPGWFVSPLTVEEVEARLGV